MEVRNIVIIIIIIIWLLMQAVNSASAGPGTKLCGMRNWLLSSGQNSIIIGSAVGPAEEAKETLNYFWICTRVWHDKCPSHTSILNSGRPQVCYPPARSPLPLIVSGHTHHPYKPGSQHTVSESLAIWPELNNFGNWCHYLIMSSPSLSRATSHPITAHNRGNMTR